jgi:hypothetical protein
MRRITEHQAKNNDHELLQVVVIWEEGLRKRDLKSRYSQDHAFLTKRRNKFKLIQEKA